MDTQSDLTDLSDAEWRLLEPLLPAPAGTGRPRRHSVRTIVNAILYELRSGCAWRLLPRDDLPCWKTVSHSFRKWRRDGTWERLHTLLRRCFVYRL